MWLVAYYDEYEGFDLSGEDGRIRLFKVKKEAKHYARHLNKKMHIPDDSANGYTYIYIEVAKEKNS